jgi:hypothetical protein
LRYVAAELGESRWRPARSDAIGAGRGKRWEERLEQAWEGIDRYLDPVVGEGTVI